jgi:hypothetical protein
MTAKTFCLSLLGAFVAIVVATMLANVVIDPEEVFQTNLLPGHSSPNTRYQRLNDYQRDARQTDALLFGSSRSTIFDRATMATLTGAKHVASFALLAGTVTDDLSFLQYVVRDKAAHGEHLKHVLLLVDTDFLGTMPWTNKNLDSFMPPEISGESRFRFWMRYLVSMQTTNWRESLRRSFGHPSAPPIPVASTGAADGRMRVAAAGNLSALMSALPTDDGRRAEDGAGVILTAGETTTEPQPLVDDGQELSRARRSVKPFLDAQLKDLATFVALCRQNGIALTVAIDPLHKLNQSSFLPGHLQEMAVRVAQVTPVWDFESPAWLASDPAYWFEASHFKPEIAALMLRRMYANGSGVPDDFGRLRQQGM